MSVVQLVGSLMELQELPVDEPLSGQGVLERHEALHPGLAGQLGKGRGIQIQEEMLERPEKLGSFPRKL